MEEYQKLKEDIWVYSLSAMYEKLEHVDRQLQRGYPADFLVDDC